MLKMFLQNNFDFIPRKLTRMQTNENSVNANKNYGGSCINDPDFAAICGFFQKFSRALKLSAPSFRDLLNWLDGSEEASLGFQELIIQLFERNGEAVHKRNFDLKVIEHCAKYSLEDASEIKARGFQCLSAKQKLRLLKELLESLFITNYKLQRYVENQTAQELRIQPLGHDRYKNVYVLRQNCIGAWCISRQDTNRKEATVVTGRKQILELMSKLGGAHNKTVKEPLNSDGAEKCRSRTLMTSLIKEEQQLLVFLEALSATLFFN